MKTKHFLSLAVLILIIIYIVFRFGIKNNMVPSSIYTPTAIDLTKSPPSSPPTRPNQGTLLTIQAQMTQNFYQEYINCLSNPPQEATGEVQSYCQTHNPFASSNLQTNLAANGTDEMDPIVCGQNPPQSIIIRKIIPEETKASAIVIEEYAAGTTELTVDLQKEDDQWKIINIHCPKQ